MYSRIWMSLFIYLITVYQSFGPMMLKLNFLNTRFVLVLHDISIYRIDIKCEPKTDYEKRLNQPQITSKIDIEWHNRQKSVWFLRCWISFWWNLCRNCSFCPFWWILVVFLGCSRETNYIENRIWKGRYQIELKKLTSSSTTLCMLNTWST